MPSELSANTDGFEVVADFGGQSVSLALPGRVFAPLAEQYRWDLLRSGRLEADAWSSVRAYAVLQPQGDPARSAVTIILVREGRKKLRRTYDISNWQGLALYVGSVLCTEEGTSLPDSVSVRLRFVGGDAGSAVHVPLVPSRLPIEKVVRRGCDVGNSGLLYLEMSEPATSAFLDLAGATRRQGVELGGCLVGRMPRLDKFVVTELVAAPLSAGSPGSFSFEPRFWLDVGSRLAGAASLRVLGWYHSHLCNAGYPSTLSAQDLAVFYRHFPAPWHIAALVCASTEECELKWYGWRDGSIGLLGTLKFDQPANDSKE